MTVNIRVGYINIPAGVYPESSYVAEVHYYVRESGADKHSLELDGKR